MSRNRKLNPIKDALTKVLTDLGFERKSDHWYLKKSETILVVNLQKSDWGGQYYLNLAVWLKALGGPQLPRENHCQIRTRLEALDPNSAELRRALNSADESWTPQERTQVVARAMREVGFPFLDRCSTVDGIRDAYLTGGLSNALVHRAVVELVAGPEEAHRHDLPSRTETKK